MSASNSSFMAPIPGMSIGHHKLGTLPHEKPPEYTDPHQALEYFWTKLTQPKIQRQIWDILKMPSATVFSVTRAILFKAAMMGVIQMNLGVVIAPIISQMVQTIAKANGIDPKMAPDTVSPQKERYIKEGLKALIAKYDKKGWLTGKPVEDIPSAPAVVPSTPEGTQDQSAQNAGAGQNTQPQQPSDQDQEQPTGIMGMAQQNSGGQ